MILQGLLDIQHRLGYLPAEELRALAQRLRVPLHRVHEVASYYPHFRLKPPPPVQVRVCRDMVCHLRGAAELRERLKTLARESSSQIAIEGASCLGQCDAAPSAVSINEQIYSGLPEAELWNHMQAAAAGQTLECQRGDRSPPGWRIDPYDGTPRYGAVRRFVQDPNHDGVLKALETANLRGMGGAGFPTARKWAAVRAAAGAAKYVICNADESEPGTFKDRELLRRTPHLVIEGMVLAGLVTGAAKGIVYLRHEYQEELDILRAALAHAQTERICGDSVLGTGRAFPIEIFVSPGGYIQGEESALLEALEDRRGEPRNKPPFPVTHGLFGMPTAINNVETLSWVPAIVLRGGEWYRDRGVNGATGIRFVSISGDVQRPGVYEVPFGQSVRDLIWTTAGGMRDEQALKAIAPSGPSGGFLPAFIPAAQLPAAFAARLPADTPGLDVRDLTLDWRTMGELGAMLGGAFVVYGERANMIEQALNCLEFFRNESCGKCVPCRLGSQQLVDITAAIIAGKDRRPQLPVIGDVAQAMSLTSICGLGQVASNPITSALKYFPADLALFKG